MLEVDVNSAFKGSEEVFMVMSLIFNISVNLDRTHRSCESFPCFEQIDLSVVHDRFERATVPYHYL